MATFASLRSQLLGMEGHDRSDMASLTLDANLALNAAYRELCHMQPWWFTEQTETITAAGGYLILSPTTIHVRDVYDADGSRVVHRTRGGQIRWADNLSYLETTSWAIAGYDTGTNAMRLHLEPATAGVYTVLSAFMPTEMAADSDVPLGPPLVGDFILWSARQDRLKRDEERQYLDMTAQQYRQQYLNELKHMHAKLSREDGPFFAR